MLVGCYNGDDGDGLPLLGSACQGKFRSLNGVGVLHFFLPNSTVVVTYRVVDKDGIH